MNTLHQIMFHKFQVGIITYDVWYDFCRTMLVDILDDVDVQIVLHRMKNGQN